MKLIIDESIDRSAIKNTILESNNGKEKRYFIEGIFAQAEKKNRNGRVYPRSVMESAINSYIENFVNDKRAIGELNHPASSPTPNPERASHIIESLNWDGHNVTGRARILEAEYFPMAKIATGMIREGVKFGVSTRGLGSLSEQAGVKIVQPDFNITAVDIVSDPSGIDCWMNGLHENAEWIFDASSNSWIIANQLKNKYKKGKHLRESVLDDFQKFLESL